MMGIEENYNAAKSETFAEQSVPTAIKAPVDKQLLEIKSRLIQALRLFILKASDGAAIAIFTNLEVQVSTA